MQLRVCSCEDNATMSSVGKILDLLASENGDKYILPFKKWDQQLESWLGSTLRVETAAIQSLFVLSFFFVLPGSLCSIWHAAGLCYYTISFSMFIIVIVTCPSTKGKVSKGKKQLLDGVSFSYYLIFTDIFMSPKFYFLGIKCFCMLRH